MRNILVTGATGFLGRHLIPVLKSHYEDHKVIAVSSKDFNLLNFEEVTKMFETVKPDIVVHLAAFSGGIGINSKLPADFFFRNSLFVSFIFEVAARSGVAKLIFPIGGCSYPAAAISPISEKQIWDGYPQIESAGYSMAKKMSLVASESYLKQHGLKSVIFIPGNMYGEFDNFIEGESHVIPGMIRRFYDAKLQNLSQISMWGDGSPVRDFVYARDVAMTIPWLIDEYDSPEPINISSGVGTSIRDLAETIKLKFDLDIFIDWDSSKPNGQSIKIFDVSKLNDFKIYCDTPLTDGLNLTINWFENNYLGKLDGIRL